MKHIIVFLLAIYASSAIAADYRDPLLMRIQEVYAQVDSMAKDDPNAALRIGKFSLDSPRKLGAKSDEDLLRARYLMQTYRLDEMKKFADRKWKKPPKGEAALITYSEWLILIQNLPALEKLSADRLDKNSDDPFALTALAELDLAELKYEPAEAIASSLIARNISPDIRSWATLILAKVHYKKQEYQRAVDELSNLIDPSTLSATIIYQLGITLIPLGQTNDAMAMFEEAIRWNPDHEFAHYYLGNGYARKNYTQLREDYPDKLCPDGTSRELSHAAAHIAAGQMDDAKNSLSSWIATNPNCANAHMMLGSVEWNLGDYASAATEFKAALKLVPEYGRAHNGLAKAFEGMRLRQSIYRQSDTKRFDALATPVVPGIDKYVLNWNSLSPRHQKQVALSVAPWGKYLPVLIESGSHHYIKPLHEMLSECPGLETIADQRVTYDSRLWDDVRGCGGFTTVTGIEDVEKSIYFSYNTVLHELTHQVHGTFPPQDFKRVEDQFFKADSIDDSGTPTYMSRYQASSEWEYFAEGANALYSLRRNEYDTREIVRERLFAMDTALVSLVQYYMTAPNLTACYPVGLCNASQDRVENQDLDGALQFVNRAAERDPNGEAVLAQLCTVHSLRDEDSLAVHFATELVKSHPDKSKSYTELASAEFYTDGNAVKCIEILSGGLPKVSDEQKNDLRQRLGDMYLYDGKYDSARAQFEEILADQPNDADALWGMGNALSGLNRFEEADTIFNKAVTKRSGIAALRLDFARMYMEWGRSEDAGKQIGEATLLAPDDSDVRAHLGWFLLAHGDLSAARDNLEKAVADDPGYRLASVLLMKLEEECHHEKEERKLEHDMEHAMKEDIPELHYVKRSSSYEGRKVWPEFLKKMLKSDPGEKENEEVEEDE